MWDFTQRARDAENGAEYDERLKPSRPCLLYRFSDPALEGLSSGQKILLRVGPENEKRPRMKLTEIRKQIAGGGLNY